MMQLPTTFLQWYFTKDDLLDTPTIIHGRTFEDEQLDRVKGCHFLLADIASTCLFIATKVEECTRRFKDIVLACAQKASKNDNLHLKEDSKEFLRWKESLLHNEILVLDTLCFDLSVEHPHTSLMKFESQIMVSGTSIRRAWMLLYQSLGAPLCVLYKPCTIAAAALLLATSLSSNDKLNENWYENLPDIDVVQVHELAAEMLEYFMDHYLVKSSTSQANSPHPSQQIQHSH
ncbi:hypothetical protein HPULCUR_008623 [Helicostylum pulchrum]|uniref:Uncharacterized protein n=1 Tax=Helicostylum pulchrum TaxID=562976 RepID=A0ABP9Y8G6_9FUNG